MRNYHSHQLEIDLNIVQDQPLKKMIQNLQVQLIDHRQETDKFFERCLDKSKLHQPLLSDGLK